MNQAIVLAKKAFQHEDVPIGAVIVRDGEIVSRGYNKRETKKNALNHAEIIAIKNACKKSNDWRLNDCEMYVTLEPCPMCAGAIINSRIRNVYFGAKDEKNGAVVSAAQLFDMNFTHKPMYEGEILGEECSEILSDFFKELRKQKVGEEK